MKKRDWVRRFAINGALAAAAIQGCSDGESPKPPHRVHILTQPRTEEEILAAYKEYVTAFDESCPLAEAELRKAIGFTPRNITVDITPPAPGAESAAIAITVDGNTTRLVHTTAALEAFLQARALWYAHRGIIERSGQPALVISQLPDHIVNSFVEGPAEHKKAIKGILEALTNEPLDCICAYSGEPVSEAENIQRKRKIRQALLEEDKPIEEIGGWRASLVISYMDGSREYLPLPRLDERVAFLRSLQQELDEQLPEKPALKKKQDAINELTDFTWQITNSGTPEFKDRRHVGFDVLGWDVTTVVHIHPPLVASSIARNQP